MRKKVLIISIIMMIVFGFAMIKGIAGMRFYGFSEGETNTYIAKIKKEQIASKGKSIGNEWSSQYKINGTTFKDGDILSIGKGNLLVFSAKLTEKDNVTSESGYSESRPFRIDDKLSKSITVKVTEKNGNNEGSYVKYKLTLSLERTDTNRSGKHISFDKKQARIDIICTWSLVIAIVAFANSALLTYVKYRIKKVDRKYGIDTDDD